MNNKEFIEKIKELDKNKDKIQKNYDIELDKIKKDFVNKNKIFEINEKVLYLHTYSEKDYEGYRNNIYIWCLAQIIGYYVNDNGDIYYKINTFGKNFNLCEFPNIAEASFGIRDNRLKKINYINEQNIPK